MFFISTYQNILHQIAEIKVGWMFCVLTSWNNADWKYVVSLSFNSLAPMPINFVWMTKMNTEKCYFIRYSIFYLQSFDNCKDKKMSDYKSVSVTQSKNLQDWKPASLINYELLLRTVFYVFLGKTYWFFKKYCNVVK